VDAVLMCLVCVCADESNFSSSPLISLICWGRQHITVSKQSRFASGLTKLKLKLKLVVKILSEITSVSGVCDSLLFCWCEDEFALQVFAAALQICCE
jgi:hypothetical protein